MSDLLFYNHADTTAAVYQVNQGNLLPWQPPAKWNKGSITIVSGFFIGGSVANGNAQLLLYNAAAGTGSFYKVDRNGISLIFTETGWRTSWTHVLAGDFNGDGMSDLLFYDAAAGVGEFYTVTATRMTLIKSNAGWRGSWTNIVAGNFGGGNTYLSDLLFYDAAAGVGEFYQVKNGSLALLKSNAGWRSSWNIIVTGGFGLLLYDAAGSTGEFYKVNKGAISLVRSNANWRKTWTQIVPGDYRGYELNSDLLFYDGVNTGEFYTVSNGSIALIASHTDWPAWTQILSNAFSVVIPTSPPPPPPPATPFVSGAVQKTSATGDILVLVINGQHFTPGESVRITITWIVDNRSPAATTVTTICDTTGSFRYLFSGDGGGVCVEGSGQTSRFQFQGTGATSAKVSNLGTAGISC